MNSSLDRSASASPIRGERPTIVQGQLDRNLFIEAVTLCALFSTPIEKELNKLLVKYKGGDPSSELEHLALTRCINLVSVINNSDSTSNSLFKQTAGANIKFNLLDKGKDFMQPFKRS